MVIQNLYGNPKTKSVRLNSETRAKGGRPTCAPMQPPMTHRSPLHLPLCDRGREENPTNRGFMRSRMLKKPLNQKPWSIREREENPPIGDPSLPKCPIGTPEWSRRWEREENPQIGDPSLSKCPIGTPEWLWRREREENTPIGGPYLSRCPIGTLKYLW